MRFWPNLRSAYGVFVLEKVAPEEMVARPGEELLADE